MAEVIVFPDAVATALDYLFDAFIARSTHDVRLGSRIENDESRFLVATLFDSEIYDVAFQRSILRFEVWVDDGPRSHENCQDLAQLVRGLLGAMQGTQQTRGTVYRVSDEGAQGTADQPDPDTGKFRYVFHIAMTMRGVAS